MHVPWTWTTMWGLTVGMGAGWVEGDKEGKISTTVMASTIKYLTEKNKNKIVHT